MYNQHEFIGGLTRSGKTFHALTQGLKSGQGVIWINPQGGNFKGYVRADKKIDLGQLKQALSQGLKINYIPSSDFKTATGEVDIIKRICFQLPNWVTVIADEADTIGRQGLSSSPYFEIAQRGLFHKVKGVFICQSPSEVDKIILKNCLIEKIFMFNDYGAKYYKSYGHDTEKLKEMLLKKGQYSYIYLENGEIKGVRKDG